MKNQRGTKNCSLCWNTKRYLYFSLITLQPSVWKQFFALSSNNYDKWVKTEVLTSNLVVITMTQLMGTIEQKEWDKYGMNHVKVSDWLSDLYLIH